MGDCFGGDITQMVKFIRILPVMLFVFSVAAGLWLSGVFFARFNIFPYPQINQLISDLKEQVKPHRYHRAVYDFHGVRIHDRNRMQPGYTLVTSYFPDSGWKTGARLLDGDGNIVHGWDINLDELFPDRTFDDTYIHGSYLFPNGDLLFNIEFAGLARVNSCGQPVWLLPEIRAHHSIAMTEDGNFWVSGNRTIDSGAEAEAFFKAYPGLVAPVFEDLLVKVSPDGEVLKSISLVDVIYRNNLQRLLPKTLGPGVRGVAGFEGDIMHLNDVEELPSSIADSYPLFEAGDLVISLRQLHLVLVIDPETGMVKWYDADSTIMQHDPDFIGDGWIGTFDNNRDLLDRGAMLGGSRILGVRPHSGEKRILYPGPPNPAFYTEFGGKWQLLANGNKLITETRAGRGFEVTAEGDLVWEWIVPDFSLGVIPELMEATRYPLTQEQVSAWACGR